MKWFKRIALLMVLVLVYVIYSQFPKLNLISGYAAKYMASSVYYAHQTEQQINENDNAAPLIRLANTQREGSDAFTSNVYGFKERKALYKKGVGAVLLMDPYNDIDHLKSPYRSIENTPIAYPYGDLPPKDTILSVVNYEKLTKAIQSAFENQELQKTRSVLVLYKGQLIGEQYIAPYTPDTPILGWSMNKSIVATLYGILQSQNQLSVEDRPRIDAWKNDERANITLDNLLRMESGLAWDETYTEISDATKMLFLSKDMGSVQEAKEAIATPASVWNYSSGTTNLLSKYLKKYFSTQQEYLDFPYRALIDKIGMKSMLLEQDLSGTYVGSSYGWASTRDWGRFGQLYLDKGLWNGEVIFNPEWVNYVATPTEDSKGDYGAHFWLNASGIQPDVPKDMYSANGHDGQFVYIIPSEDLVIVRTGLSEAYDANQLISGIINAIED